MGTRNERNHWLLALALALTLVACGDDDEEQGPPDTGGGFTNTDAGEDEPDAEEEDPDGGVEEDAGETLQASAEEAKKNDWVEGCYKKPTDDKEFLNSCATGWRTFDESWYPSGWKVGDKLPALP